MQEKPYANVLLGAVENLNRIIGRRAIDRAAAILLQELKERLTRCEQEERASVGLSLCDGTRQFNLEPAPFPWVVLVMTQLSVR